MSFNQNRYTLVTQLCPNYLTHHSRHTTLSDLLFLLPGDILSKSEFLRVSFSVLLQRSNNSV